MIAQSGLQKCQAYIADVKAGSFPVCAAIVGQVDRHLRDLDRQRSNAFPYYFDETLASSFIDVFELLLRHSIGEYAGRPFVLEPWQAFGIGQLYGWRRLDDQTRRYRELYWSTGRKNGKSCIASGLSIISAGIEVNPVAGKPEPVAEVVLAATKKEQSERVIFAECLRMIAQSPLIDAETKTVNKQIEFLRNGGSIRCIGSDKPFDGLNPHFVGIDEFHAFGDFHRPFFDTMTTGSGSRLQPLTGIFTTAGNTQSALWLENYRRFKSVALGDFEAHETLPIIYELDEDDDPLDETLWVKANPNLGVSVKLDYLRQQASKARTSPTELNRFVRYHGNRLVSANQKALDVDQWDECAGTLSDWSDADTIGAGVDLGGRDDLASFALVARFEIPGETREVSEGEFRPVYRYECLVFCYIAADTPRDLTAQPFANFVASGEIKVCKFPVSELKNDLLDKLRELPVSSTAYDPSNGQQLGESIESEGFPIGSMGQNARHFNEPIGELMQAVREGRFTHNGSPCLRWMVGNAVTITDRQGRVMFDKSHSSEKIDGLVSMVMALRRAMLAPSSPTGSLFIS